MDTFVYLPKISVLHWKWITACLSIQIVPYTKVPWSLLCASVHCCTPLLAVLARILEAKSLLLIYAKPPDPIVNVPLYPMEVVLKPAWTNMYCYAAMAISIIIVWKVPTLLVTLIVLQPISVTEMLKVQKMLKVPITLERHWNNAIACHTIQGALVLQRLSSDCTSTAFI